MQIYKISNLHEQMKHTVFTTLDGALSHNFCDQVFMTTSKKKKKNVKLKMHYSMSFLALKKRRR